MPDAQGAPAPARASRARGADPQSDVIWRLTERVKELTALHGAARVMQDDAQSPEDLVRRVLPLLPPAWQFPEVTEARIVVGEVAASTPG